MINLEPLTPQPQERKPMTMSFYDALKRIREDKMVKRVSWGNKDYCFLDNGYLSIYRNDKNHIWQISDGDMDGNDWIIVTELN